jgi:hypothetical protein
MLPVVAALVVLYVARVVVEGWARRQGYHC